MPLRDLMLYIGDGDDYRRRAAMAIELAASENAHLTILAFAPNAIFPIYGEPGIAPPMPVSWFEDMAARKRQRLEELAQAAAREGVACETRLMQGMAGDQSALLVEQAIYGDMMIVSQPRDDAIWSSGGEIISQVLMHARRPVLSIPCGKQSSKSWSADNILAAWDGGAEAARALQDALPLLKKARRVALFIAGDALIRGDEPGAGMARHLARHDVNVEVVRREAGTGAIGEMVLRQAGEEGADLIVMGGFRHSRLRELVIGGVTRKVLEKAEIPVMLSH
jgi:nucleotide-binding universal stress UspA family protein